ncbi:hypothetical protein [Moorena sp. SIOASIH]|uniref:hypothetical protein n=1 Tax=Moorena sp. SIOASIH TaxID=2607817 RepID=UPI0025D74064|nr:hypothetical protein [Moorena sp. SIOASIH]
MSAISDCLGASGTILIALAISSFCCSLFPIPDSTTAVEWESWVELASCQFQYVVEWESWVELASCQFQYVVE